MEQKGTIEIHIVGSKGHSDLSPDNYDIRDLKAMLTDIEDLLYPNKKNCRPDITYHIEDGSVRNIFKTSLQAVVTFGAVLSLVSRNGTLDGLELPTANALAHIQDIAFKTNSEFEFLTSLSDGVQLRVNPSTNYRITQELWADTEYYIYGQLTNAGGKGKSNIHIDTKDSGTFIVNVEKSFLKNATENMLYKEYGVRVMARQNILTGELDRQSLRLIELVDYTPKYDESYLNSLITKVGNRFDGIDADYLINEMRGNH